MATRAVLRIEDFFTREREYFWVGLNKDQPRLAWARHHHFIYTSTFAGRMHLRKGEYMLERPSCLPPQSSIQCTNTQ
jgi:hypothetical protein